ncbi:3'(2'),5'-bisphosphate nucleotidase CysQ family protein [Oceanobacillus saliphilus]|uniref:3'(2'),5'-bisphosphate nucleotidase CysQ family protein n=1 Tax=Oceanobacillus saliphilus TaxID=2925834 RepID=UPI00201D45B9|nr:inositol monophosphatase family protein [Oceanobacillus saliphilus]
MIEEIMDIVISTGKLIVKNSEVGSKGKWKGTQFKSKADQIAHEALFRLLHQLDNIPIISEEESTSLVEKRPRRYWLIDPIDGTASFVQGFSGFVTQVALMEDNKPVMAAIYAPKLDSLYSAVKGEGAYHNGSRLFLKGKDNIDTLIDNYPYPNGLAKKVYDQFSCSNYIECGSISLKICKVADATADLFVKDVIVRDWDIAAPQLILEEAGGFLSDIQGNTFFYNDQYNNNGLVASNSSIHCKEVAKWYNKLDGKDERG